MPLFVMGLKQRVKRDPKPSSLFYLTRKLRYRKKKCEHNEWLMIGNLFHVKICSLNVLQMLLTRIS